MNDPRRAERAARRLSEEAAAWYLDMRESPDLRTRERFLAWLRHSPGHVAEYLAVAQMHGDLRAAAALQGTSLDDLRRAAAREPSVVPLFGEFVPARAEPARRPRRVLPWAAAAMFVIAAGVALVWPAPSLEASRYVAENGAVHAVTLDDGTLMQMSPGSIVDVSFDHARRRITLVKGRASLDVGKDSRPLTVFSGDQQIEDVGTVFDVDRADDGTHVTVISGKVAVWQSPTPWLDRACRRLTGVPASRERIADVAGGESALIDTDGRVLAHTRSDPADATAWLPEDIRFHDVPVADVARRFNAYTSRPLVVEGHALDARRISGVFHAHDPDAFVSYLGSLPGVRIVHDSDRVRIVDATRQGKL